MKLDFNHLEKALLDYNAKSELKQAAIIMVRNIFKEAETKQCTINGVVNWLPFNKENYRLYEKLAMQNNCYIRYDNGQEQDFTDKEMPFARVTHFRAKS
jgi:hypothetical protein